MADCLGIYLNDEVLRFAKLSSENGKNVKLEQYGVRFVKTNKTDAIDNLIQETNSSKIPIAINPLEDFNINIQMFDQVQNKSYVSDVVKMEFEAWCEKNAKSPERYNYIYKVADLKGSDNKRSAVINITEAKYIEEIMKIMPNQISSIYPSELIINRIVSLDEQNYLLVNLDDTLVISTVIGGKLADIKTYNIGMRQILDDFKIKLGSYQKAYEACKQLNVYSDGTPTNNNKELEAITEPVLQDILRNIQANLGQHKEDVTKVLIAGTGILFTNIDILFTEYLEIKCEILKPAFLSDTSNVRNVAEILETMPAIALAYDQIVPQAKEIEYIKPNAKLKNKFSSLFSKMPKSMNILSGTKENGNTKDKNDAKIEKNTNENRNTRNGIPNMMFASDKLRLGLTCATIVAGLFLLTYVIFSSLYVSRINKMSAEVSNNIQKLKDKTAEVNSDLQYVTSNTDKYKSVNDKVATLVQQIENQQIGKFTTYNVATFLQNIIKVIPKNVKLNSISSDDNKHVTIIAQSDNYADLGYFIAELKINNTLNSVKINNIKNGEITIVEIGGELP